MSYITLVFDIKKSRELANRNEIQRILIQSLKKCNEKFEDIIASPFIIIIGDEWQGLLKEGSDFKEIISFFKSSLPSNVEFYTGVGIGDITINDFELTVNQLDGPAFHLARYAIKYAKRKNYSLVVFEN